MIMLSYIINVSRGVLMKKIAYNNSLRGHDILKILRIPTLALLILVSVAGATQSTNIKFVTNGSSFSPIITVTGNPQFNGYLVMVQHLILRLLL